MSTRGPLLTTCGTNQTFHLPTKIFTDLLSEGPQEQKLTGTSMVCYFYHFLLGLGSVQKDQLELDSSCVKPRINQNKLYSFSQLYILYKHVARCRQAGWIPSNTDDAGKRVASFTTYVTVVSAAAVASVQQRCTYVSGLGFFCVVHCLLDSNSNQTKFRMYGVANLSFQNKLRRESCTQECLKLSIERKKKWTKSLLIFWGKKKKTVKYAKGYKQAEKYHCKLGFGSDLISCPAVRRGRIEFLSD